MRQLGLTGKLVAMALACGLVPLVIVQTVVNQALHDVEATKGKEVATAATSVADLVDRNLFERYGDVQAFALNAVLQDRQHWYQPGEGNPIVRAMNAYVDTYDIYYLTVLTDLEGRVIAVNSRDADGQPIDTAFLYEANFRNSAWFGPVSRGAFTEKRRFSAAGNDVSTGTYIEDFHVDEHVKRAYPGDEGLAIAFSAPVVDADGNAIAYWSNRTRFSVVEDIVASVYQDLKSRSWGSAEITVLDNQGRVIVDYDPMSRGTEAITRDMSVLGRLNLLNGKVKAAERVLGGEQGSMISEHARKGISQLAGFAHLKGALGYPGMDWGVLVRVPEAEAVADTTAVRRTLWFTGLAVLLLLAGVATFLGRRLSRPIIDISRAAEQMAQGDFNVEIHHTGTDEVGRLADNFRSLVGYAHHLADGADALSAGNLDFAVAPRSAEDRLAHSFGDARKTLLALKTALQQLIDAVRDGELRERAATSGFEGVYRDLAEGLNAMVEAVEKPVQGTHEALERLAARDLTTRMRGDFRGRFSDMQDAVNEATNALEHAMGEVSSASEQVSSAARQISSGSQNMANSATTRASALEEIAASVEELTATSRSSADQAEQARTNAEEARTSANAGMSNMGQLSESILRIKSAADETAKIVKTIDEIAFQTNLLALNAAVEAARAGDAGRGFTVVAEEVRNLAQRSAEAARTTADLIAQSVRSAEDGVAHQDAMRARFQEIEQRVEDVVQLMAGVSAASVEQSQGLSQINSAVDHMSRGTQEDAATTEEAAAGAHELESQARSLSALMGTFRVGHAPKTRGVPVNDNHAEDDDWFSAVS